jgi:hypothetical protein
VSVVGRGSADRQFRRHMNYSRLQAVAQGRTGASAFRADHQSSGFFL